MKRAYSEPGILPKLRLTEISVRNLKAPAAGQVTYSDVSLPGFGIRLSAGGSANWVVMHGKDRRRLSIGKYPVVGIAKAREEAKKLIGWGFNFMAVGSFRSH